MRHNKYKSKESNIRINSTPHKYLFPKEFKATYNNNYMQWVIQDNKQVNRDSQQ